MTVAQPDRTSPLVRLVRRLTGSSVGSSPDADEQLVHHLEAVAHVAGREVLDVALDSLMRLIGAQRGFIAVRDEDASLHFVVARAFSSLDLDRPEAQLSRSILDAAFEDAGMVSVADASGDGRFAQAKSVRALGLKAVLVVPLLVADTPFGVLYLDNPTQTAVFDAARRQSARQLAELVAPVVHKELELMRLRRTVAAQMEPLRAGAGLAALAGESKAMLDVLTLIAKVAPTRATVLVTGETGTGKELVARALHQGSRRADGPFVAINCAALPASLLEAELFGHDKGAFTGAERERVGRFEAADGGTLFMDEIADLSPEAQAKLLRVIEEGVFERVGSTSPTKVNVRLVAATHRDLSALVASGAFREDLLFRIRVMEVRLPPLRERDADVLVIAQQLLTRAVEEHSSAARELSPAARLALQTYRWPGNVRELRNVIERAAILASGPTIDVDLLPPEIVGAAPDGGHIDIRQAVREFKRRFVQQARAAADGDHRKTAELLGVNPKYLYQMLKDLDL